jgi:DNA-binding LacI/PurR family transcriptional regulator
MKKSGKIFGLIIAMMMVIPMIAACGTAQPAATTAPVVEQPTTAVVVEQPTTAAPATTTGGTITGTAFDAWIHPRIKADGKITLAYVHSVPTAESQFRSVQQAQVECAHRGWTYVDMVYPDISKVRDTILNAINQNVDIILMGNTQSMESYTSLFDQARTAGIGVYNNDNQLVPGILMNSTMPNGVSAMLLMYAIGVAHGWKDSIGFITVPTIQVANERIEPMKALLGAYPNEEVLGTEDTSTNPSGNTVGAYEVAKAWVQKYGTDMTGIIAFADSLGMAATEGLIASGDANGTKYWVAAIDGGSQGWGYIRNITPFQFSYAQPFELYTHKIFEVMDQLQVKGLNPGDPGCDIKASGDTLYSTGLVITRENVPAVGQNIHSVYSYYDANDTTAWYTWNEGPGIYKIIEGLKKEIPAH